jgi:hypothetical protein
MQTETKTDSENQDDGEQLEYINTEHKQTRRHSRQKQMDKQNKPEFIHTITHKPHDGIKGEASPRLLLPGLGFLV